MNNKPFPARFPAFGMLAALRAGGRLSFHHRVSYFTRLIGAATGLLIFD